MSATAMNNGIATTTAGTRVVGTGAAVHELAQGEEPTSDPMPVDVALCVITFRRPEGLSRLLDALGRLDVPAAVRLSVVVVDNDPEGSARTVVDAATTALPHTVRYAVESARGIPMARNRALKLALDLQPQFIAWIDDDEHPEPDWLCNLWETQNATDADVVMGPGVPLFEPGTPAWIQEPGLFDHVHFETGRDFPYFYARTSGILVRASVVPAERFDERLALTGGEDRLFFTRIHRAGGRFVWDDRAVVHDHIPRSRATSGWLIRRWYRTGVTRSLTMVYLDHPGALRRARRVLGGLAMAGGGLVRTLIGLRRGRTEVLRRWRIVMLGLGASAGALGIRYQEYRSVHGS